MITETRRKSQDAPARRGGAEEGAKRLRTRQPAGVAPRKEGAEGDRLRTPQHEVVRPTKELRQNECFGGRTPSKASG
ncbi:MAG: hypothetical protein Q8R13_04520 [bacterium]|nr:hypothetical protein [bacterium]